jgi:hypothetical protein
MSDHPGVGKQGSLTWPELLDMWNEKIDSRNIFGKTVEHLQQHHANEWTHINAKLKAVRQGSDGLIRLQRAVGLLRTDLQNDFEIDPTLGEILDRAGAGDIIIGALHVDNARIPRQSQLVTQESLFGSNPSLEPTFRRKVGRPPSVKNKTIRRKRDCANKLCSRWFDCMGGAIHTMCQWSNGNNLEHLTTNQRRQRRRHFDKLMLNNPTLSREEAALQIQFI